MKKCQTTVQGGGKGTVRKARLNNIYYYYVWTHLRLLAGGIRLVRHCKLQGVFVQVADAVAQHIRRL